MRSPAHAKDSTSLVYRLTARFSRAPNAALSYSQTTDIHSRILLNQKKLVLGLAAICGAVWIIAAIHPLDQEAWLLENILLVLFVATLAVTYRWLKLSTASYILLAAFVVFHIIGAHYTYARMPLGLWARDYFHLSRNHYDRFAHGAFGFLLAFPIRELLLRFSRTERAWSFWLSPAIVLGVSGLFEIIESIVAEAVAPGKGVAWLGGQGDEWDAQNDMLSAFIGSLLMMGIVALRERAKMGGKSSSTRHEYVSPRPKKSDSYFLPIAVACYVGFWIILAIHPLDRSDWLLENLLIFISVAVLALTYRRFQFSNTSYALILIFLTFHTIGAHYTYAKVPIGFWAKDWLHLSRNHYDRVIHFSFGFLLLYPMRELLIRSAHANAAWATWLALAALCAFSSFFEILEGVIAQFVRPDLGAAYLGTQGDIWDAQKDMGAAFVGALIVATLLSFHRARRKN
jgi:putative membrane protein